MTVNIWGVFVIWQSIRLTTIRARHRSTGLVRCNWTPMTICTINPSTLCCDWLNICFCALARGWMVHVKFSGVNWPKNDSAGLMTAVACHCSSVLTLYAYRGRWFQDWQYCYLWRKTQKTYNGTCQFTIWSMKRFVLFWFTSCRYLADVVVSAKMSCYRCWHKM